jgi:cell division protein FtsZ
MTSNSDFGSITFDLPKNQSNVIKVIGVGGGGSNAINHMFKQGIKGVDFIVCNTDSQALENSSVPNKIQLGVNLTEGLGAGANPEVGQQSALESISDIEKMLDVNTKMVFITAGMGGGTGTGAAPVIAQLAKERNILTVGIVTIPFLFEGKIRQDQALQGVERLRKQVDSLIVINNNKLREVYGNLGFKAGFSKADEVLATASRGIAEVITHHYTQNIDLKDAKTVLANSGTAIMGSSTAEGENRAKDAIVAALDSPLLNDNKITGARNVLLLIVSGTNEITIDEIGEINDHIQAEAGFNANIIMGVGEDETLGDSIAVTIIATGFNVEQQNEIVNTEPKRIIHSLEEEQKLTHNLTQKVIDSIQIVAPIAAPEVEEKEEKIVFELIEEEEVRANEVVSVQEVKSNAFEFDLVPTSEFIKNIDVTFEIVLPVAKPSNFETTPVVDFIPVEQKVAPTTQEFFFSEPEVAFTQKEEVPVAKEEEQITFMFDLPINNEPKSTTNEPEKMLFSIDANDIDVKQAVHVVPMTELNESGVVRYSLEEYLELENVVLQAKEEVKVVEPIDEELQFTAKTLDFMEPQASESKAEITPLEMSIDEAARWRAEERKRKLKEFNYKFHSNLSRVEEFEKEPAYKRQGVDLTDENSGGISRTSLGLDSNNEVQLRTNNSFLHDNVD